MYTIGVIGGGAAGFFAAIQAASTGNKVVLFEKTSNVLSKVKVSGGGRCNVTHDCMVVSKLIKFYPRGEKFLKKVFVHFSVEDTVKWFTSRGVPIKVEADGRMFPVSNSSQTIIDVLIREAEKAGVILQFKAAILQVIPLSQGFNLLLKEREVRVDKLIITSGGHPKKEGYEWIESLGHHIVSPVPSLFTFNTPNEPLTDLQGIAMPDAHVRLEGTKLSYEGPLLITHWGLSGPAVLKLSAYGANWLHDADYKAKAHIRWNKKFQEEELRSALLSYKSLHPKRKIYSHPLFEIPNRLWIHLVHLAEIPSEFCWMNISKKQNNKLLENLFRFTINIHGKTTYKEEFVTAGGVDLEEIDPLTMESKLIPGLYFAGEVLNVDGITGGFNFQAAWSTGFLAGKNATH